MTFSLKIKQMEKLGLKGKMSWVLGLVFECPFHDPVKNCPAIKFRALPIEEAATLINDMEENQLDEMLSFHRQCLRDRERELLGRKG